MPQNSHIFKTRKTQIQREGKNVKLIFQPLELIDAIAPVVSATAAALKTFYKITFQFKCVLCRT